MDLLWAVTRGSLDEVDDAIEKGSDLTVRDGEGNTAMLKACMRGEKKIVKALMRAGSSLGDKNNDGEGVLHITFSNGFVDLGIYLLHKGADPGMETADGMDWITVSKAQLRFLIPPSVESSLFRLLSRTCRPIILILSDLKLFCGRPLNPHVLLLIVLRHGGCGHGVAEGCNRGEPECCSETCYGPSGGD